MSNHNYDIIDTLGEVNDRSTEHSKTFNDRIANMEKNINNYPKVYFPDYTSQLDRIGVQVDMLVNGQPDNKLELAIDRLEKKLDKALKSSPEQIKLKMLFVYFSLVIATAISFGFALALKLQVNALVGLLHEEPGNISKPTPIQSQSHNLRPAVRSIGHKTARQHHTFVKQ
ncbi:hypothetical protein AAFN85_25925 [Mucilaginibacter sp. CAU 1740]|uniref:hypothetical protein n=1 Tax=Mucilaginibacter sp. CAU 1740 TaxID=3140365 RepID=UPI00325BF949